MQYYTPVSLADHLRGCASNSLANLQEQPLLGGLVAEVHAFYGDVLNVVLSLPEGAGIFLGLSHGAYLAAFQLAVSGEFPPAYAVLRTCVEHALVAHRVYRNPELKSVWIKRDENDATGAAARKAFRYSVMKSELTANHPVIANQFSTVYDACITLGGHPNPGALLPNLRTDPSSPEGFRTSYLYVSSDELSLQHALYSVGFGGMTALTIFAYIYLPIFVGTEFGERLRRVYERANTVAPSHSGFGAAVSPLKGGPLTPRR
jgi:hypothetical protein